MREIKFEYVYSNGKDFIKESFTLNEIENGDPFDVMSDSPLLRDYKLIVRRQYTGLTDKNGREIYEDDIVVIPNQYIWFDGKDPNYVGIVEWLYSQWQVIARCVNQGRRGISEGMNYGLNDYGWDECVKSDWLIIGNIYENPELLEAK